jgi:hypothetical protein
LTCDGRLPLDEQLARFEQALRSNRTLTEVLARAATLDLPSTQRPAAGGGAKTERWQRQWPALTILPWPVPG